MMNTTDKLCKNCNHYAQHYVKRSARFSLTDCGHCLKFINKKDTAPNCKLWQQAKTSDAPDYGNIKNTLKRMAKQIDEICSVLKDG